MSRSQSTGGRPPITTDEEILEAIKVADSDATLNGCPRYRDVATHVDISDSQLKDRIYALRDEGRVKTPFTIDMDVCNQVRTVEVADEQQ